MLKSTLAAVAIAALTPVVAAAQDDTTAEQDSALSVRIDLSQNILAIAYPEETREPMFRAVSEQMEAQMLQSLQGRIDDPAVLQLVTDWQDKVSAQTNSVMLRHIDHLMNGWARAYADVFTEQELRDILAFVSTDTGQSFMLKSTDVLSNPHYTAVSQKFLDEVTEVVMAGLPELMASIVALQHSQTQEAQ